MGDGISHIHRTEQDNVKTAHKQTNMAGTECSLTG